MNNIYLMLTSAHLFTFTLVGLEGWNVNRIIYARYIIIVHVSLVLLSREL